LFIGPVFTREAAVAPRRARLYIWRTLYVLILFVFMCTAWLIMAGTQANVSLGDTARFGTILFQILAPLQLAIVAFLSALFSASAVAQEKDRKTLILLLLSRLTNMELVVGKLLASLLTLGVMLAAALPLFMFIAMLGGVSFAQVARVFGVTAVTALATGSLGSTLALWREKTYQSLALTALVLVIWIGLWQVVAALDGSLLGVTFRTWATGFSPIAAIYAAASPVLKDNPALGVLGNGVNLFLVVGGAITVLINAVAVWRIRAWNPSREVRPTIREGEREAGSQESIWGVAHDLARETARPGPAPGGGTSQPSAPATSLPPTATPQRAGRETGSHQTLEQAQSGHVDAGRLATRGTSRNVWDNPILWRETCTWAYGRKVLAIRVVYVLLAVAVLLALSSTIGTAEIARSSLLAVVPAPALLLAPFFFVSLMIVNALAVNSITNERDGQALDLLLATDLTPRELVLGKLAGVLWVTREMVVTPMLLCLYLLLRGEIGPANLLFLIAGLAVMNVFAAVLGLHSGMTYANSRTAIGVSMGTLFFLCVGVITCMLMMISLSGSFQTQLWPFLAVVLGGGVGLYVSLGARRPSSAILLASLVLPFATFFAITSFLLRNHELTVFLVTIGAYGFTTAALLVPAISDFDVAMGRTHTVAD
jgi:ABC-type transport system involved in multi-copper enzyme maturation permease subunit